MSKFDKNREKKVSRYSIPTYANGVQFPPKEPVPTNANIANGALGGAMQGAQIGSNFGPYGALVGGLVGGVGGTVAGIYEKRQAEIYNRNLKNAEEGYKKYGDKATDPKLQTIQYEDGGIVAEEPEDVIEIEGKYGVGEIHVDSDYNIKTIGDNPHSNGGTKTTAQEGDAVFPTQGDKEKHDKIMSLISAYKNGDMRAKEELDAIKETLPKNEEKAHNGAKYQYFKQATKTDNNGHNVNIVKNGDIEYIEGTPQYNEVISELRKTEESGKKEEENKRKQEEWRNAPTGLPKAEPYYLIGRTNDGSPIISSKPVKTSETPTSTKFNTNTNSTVKTNTSNSPSASLNTVDRWKTYIPVQPPAKVSQPVKPTNQTAPVQQTSKFRKPDNPVVNQDADIVDFITGNQDVKDEYELRERARKLGIPEDKLLNTLDEIHKDITPNATGSRNSKVAYGNIGPKTFKAFKLDIPSDETTSESRVIQGRLIPSEGTPESTSEGTSEGTTIAKEKFNPAPSTTKNPRYINKFGNLGMYENSLRNTISSFDKIEGAPMFGLNLDRYKYEDLSAPQREEIRRQGAVARYNTAGTYGSRGQQLSYLTQADQAVANAINQVNNQEVARKYDINNANVGLTNTERQFATQEQLRVDDLLRRQRSAKTKFGQEASQERTQKAYMNEQASYMRSRDEREQDMNELLAKLLYSRNFEIDPIYDENDRVRKDNRGVVHKPE